MVTLQILVLSFLVRVQVAQRKLHQHGEAFFYIRINVYKK